MSATVPILSLTAAVFAGIIALELATGAPSAPAGRPASGAVAGPSAMPPADQAPQQVAALLARPPFSPDRRPEAVQGGEDPRLPHLTGILVTSQERKAIFAGRDGGQGAVVGQGDQVGAYRVQEISATNVTLAGADGSHIVRPTFSTAPPPMAAPPLAVLSLPQIPPQPAAALGLPTGAAQTPNAPVLPAAGAPR